MENKNTNTLNVIVNEFAKHGVNIIQFLENLDAIVTGGDDFVNITIKDENGNEVTKKLPSIGKMKNDISSLKALLDDLYNIKNNEVFVSSNGIKYPILIPEYPYDLLPPFNLIKEGYNYKNDKFFTRLYLNNINNLIRYKKYIINTTDDVFDEININNEVELLNYIDNNNIKYKLVDEVLRNNPGTIRFIGSFLVLSNIKNIYTLNTLNYTNSNNETFRLNIGDILYFDNTEVRIDEIDFNVNTIKVTTLKGYNMMSVGKELKLLSPFNQNEYIDIPCGVEEKYILFIKNINERFNIESVDFSIPIKINVLKLTNDNKNETLGKFNVNQIVVEKTIPLSLGIEPNAPILNGGDFNVVRINDHLFQGSIVTSIQEKVSRKNELISEITEIDKAIDEKKSLLASTQEISKEKINFIQNDLNGLVGKRKIKTSEYSSIINELNTINKDQVKFIKPKFRIRGFFDIPSENFSEITGTQYIVQFVISYRYKGMNQETSQNKNFVRTDATGNKKYGVFSDWIEVESPKRVKTKNDDGVWLWEDQQTEDGQKVNINQIDIPIQKGEIVEFRIKSVSEAGYPTEPMMSKWSNVVSLPFPDELTDINTMEDIISNSLVDDANILVDNILASKGVDVHLRNSLIRNEQYLAHPAHEISSGIYDTVGNILTVENVLKQYQNEITELRKIIQREIPELKVSLITPQGEEIPLNTNTNNKIFGGYYLEDLNNFPLSQQTGAVINKDFQLYLYNTSGTPLYFRAGVIGGIGQGITPTDTFYMLDGGVDRKYEKVPIYYEDNTKGFYEQKKGQFLYMRYKDYKLKDNLYINLAGLGSTKQPHLWYVGDPQIKNDYKYFTQGDLSLVSQPIFTDNETGCYAFLAPDSLEDLYVGASTYGSVKELKSGRENGIRIPINFKYRLQNNTGQPIASNVEFSKKIGFDIYLYQLNTISIDLEFISKYSRDTF
jgi:hypothetical protein